MERQLPRGDGVSQSASTPARLLVEETRPPAFIASLLLESLENKLRLIAVCSQIGLLFGGRPVENLTIQLEYVFVEDAIELS